MAIPVQQPSELKTVINSSFKGSYVYNYIFLLVVFLSRDTCSWSVLILEEKNRLIKLFPTITNSLGACL